MKSPARIPKLGRFADHHGLVVRRGASADCWEVWQTPGECDTSWGHLLCSLMVPSSGVGNGPGSLVQRWTSDEAVDLAAPLESSPITYPWLHRYRAFPGPSSNTYVQWALGRMHKLGWRGIGRSYKAYPGLSLKQGNPLI